MIATTLAYALATALGQPQSYWAVLTAIIVTQTSIGGSLKAAIDRLVGSICGDTIRQEGITRALPTDVLARILGSAFAVEQLQRDLDDFVERTRGVTTWTR
ncbi:MAG: FUSC family protein [Verrucomicrobia bacterium]|nr:FUSC family protein [Verrucomicrobiota bacterium]